MAHEKELFTLDPENDFRRDKLIENYESFIWTDRYSDLGDFSLVCEPTRKMINTLQPDTLIGFTESDRVMQVVTSLRKEDSAGSDTLSVTAKALEQVLDNRPAKKLLSPANWALTGSVGAMVAELVSTVCILGTGVSTDDVIPELTVSDLSGTTTSYSSSIKTGSVYERARELCKAADLGLRITCVPGSGVLAFAVFAGADRSGSEGIAFSKDLENLASTSSLVSKDGFKSVAYVYSANGSAVVYSANATAAEVIGLKRKTILVEATDITLPAGAALQSALIQRGKDVLAEHKKLALYDGQVIPTGPYVYNQHYFLGDLAALINDEGTRQVVRVTEHIWSRDSSGFASYPTLSAVGGV